MLYLVATPIGNLADITLRALDILKNCDYILCEDTRHSSVLLQHYDIKKPLKSYHKFNEASRAHSVLEDLKNGKTIGVISDAGTPGICDPGSELIRLCIQENVLYSAIPGPSAVILAATLSGFNLEKFQFVGFLPKKENELKQKLYEIFTYSGTTVCYESPHRLHETMQWIAQIEPHREVAVARELTKKFEQVLRGNACDILKHFEQHDLKGEMVLVIAPPSKNSDFDESSLTPAEHVAWVQKTYLLDKKEAIKIVAQLRGLPKRNVYTQTL